MSPPEAATQDLSRTVLDAASGSQHGKKPDDQSRKKEATFVPPSSHRRDSSNAMLNPSFGPMGMGDTDFPASDGYGGESSPLTSQVFPSLQDNYIIPPYIVKWFAELFFKDALIQTISFRSHLKHGEKPDDVRLRDAKKGRPSDLPSHWSFLDQYQPFPSASQRRLAVLAQPAIEFDLEVAFIGFKPRSAPYALVCFGMLGSLVLA